MTRGFAALAVIVIVFGLALGVAIGMWQSGASVFAAQSANTTPSSSSRGESTTPTANSANTSSANRSSRSVTGAVESVAGNEFTVKSQIASTTVAFAPDTSIRKTVAISLTELAVGETVVVAGSRGTDGLLAAQSVQVGIADQVGVAGGEEARPAAMAARSASTPAGEQARPGGPSAVSGTIDSLGAGRLVIKTATGNVTANVSEQTMLSKNIDGTRADLVPGANVIVAGREATGGLTATSIQILQSGGPLRRITR